VRNQSNEDFPFTVEEAGLLNRNIRLPQTGSHPALVVWAGVGFAILGWALIAARQKVTQMPESA
jgi:LPXTG-motif cell wall-anchored protein